jgi:hypothetical protein
MTRSWQKAIVQAAMTTESQQSIPDESRWLEQAGKLLANLGFTLVEPNRAKGDETSHLLIALRSQPTLAHFDPEKIDYWITESGRGRPRLLDRESHYPIASEYAWGRIVATDRLGVRNEFLSFGGGLRAQMTSDTTILIDFASHAPILRWSGHSQTSDPLSGEVGAFFARLKVPIDFVPGAEALIAQSAATTLYCAFVQHVRERLTDAKTFREANRWLADWSTREAQRIQTASPDHWAAALELRKQLSAIEAIARE